VVNQAHLQDPQPDQVPVNQLIGDGRDDVREEIEEETKGPAPVNIRNG